MYTLTIFIVIKNAYGKSFSRGQIFSTQLIQLLTESIAKNWRTPSTNRLTCMIASMRRRSSAKIFVSVCVLRLNARLDWTLSSQLVCTWNCCVMYRCIRIPSSSARSRPQQHFKMVQCAYGTRFAASAWHHRKHALETWARPAAGIFVIDLLLTTFPVPVSITRVSTKERAAVVEWKLIVENY